ncbi:Pescadillo N-terminus-domain-containing protein [Phlyctochytrium arcticum]|nr:Pescadillo N-terminus-domain-containing protein [Phlyctochytrium arcticum]
MCKNFLAQKPTHNYQAKMGKKIKKGEKGAATNYITRTQAIKKLQISLAAFRRLCILKGIYPREPNNKKKVGKGSTAPKTYYYRKDILCLLHEPLLQTLREQKIHIRKINKAVSKQEYAQAKELEENKPEYSLHHIIRERYPTFSDALKDLDDALSMIFLFANLPTNTKIDASHIRKCQKLSSEFQHYIMYSRSLRKVFLSIKGIYYQAEINGQPITWIVPYKFSQHVPSDVDFRVMGTFLELYEHLVSFVNFKLYSDANLLYPPRLDTARDNSGAGLLAYVVESQKEQVPALDDATGELVDSVPESKVAKERLNTLGTKLQQIAAVDKEDSVAPRAKLSDQNEPDVGIASEEHTESGKSHDLFKGLTFRISREVPQESTDFLLLSFGAQIVSQEDAPVNYVLTDRITSSPSTQAGTPVQPQWIYDSVNAGHLLPTYPYTPGQTLPPHFSPFAEMDEENADDVMEGQEVAEPAAPTEGEATAAEEKELAMMMMSKRDRHLYNKIQFGKERKAQKAAKVRSRRPPTA